MTLLVFEDRVEWRLIEDLLSLDDKSAEATVFRDGRVTLAPDRANAAPIILPAMKYVLETPDWKRALGAYLKDDRVDPLERLVFAVVDPEKPEWSKIRLPSKWIGVTKAKDDSLGGDDRPAAFAALRKCPKNYVAVTQDDFDWMEGCPVDDEEEAKVVRLLATAIGLKSPPPRYGGGDVE